jgi:hypothetical protein
MASIDLPSLMKRILKIERQIAQLLRRRPETGAMNLDELDDFEAKYKHWTDLPRQDQAARWDPTRDTRFGGLASFRDPQTVEEYFTVPITGDGTFGLDDSTPLAGEFLVGSDWELDRPCLATATIAFNGSYTPQAVSPPTDPASFHRPPTIVAELIDGDEDRETAPGPGFEIATDAWEIVTPSGFETKTKSLLWIYGRGRPKVRVRVDVSADAAPGLAGSPELLVITRATRL